MDRFLIRIGDYTPIDYTSTTKGIYLILAKKTGYKGFFYIEGRNSDEKIIRLRFPPLKATENYDNAFSFNYSGKFMFSVEDLKIDDKHPRNHMVFNVTQFGAIGKPIAITLMGFYFDVFGMRHTINGTISILRTQ